MTKQTVLAWMLITLLGIGAATDLTFADAPPSPDPQIVQLRWDLKTGEVSACSPDDLCGPVGEQRGTSPADP